MIAIYLKNNKNIVSFNLMCLNYYNKNICSLRMIPYLSRTKLWCHCGFFPSLSRLIAVLQRMRWLISHLVNTGERAVPGLDSVQIRSGKTLEHPKSRVLSVGRSSILRAPIILAAEWHRQHCKQGHSGSQQLPKQHAGPYAGLYSSNPNTPLLLAVTY